MNKIVAKLEKIKLNVGCKKTAGLRSGNFSDLNSACAVLVHVKIFPVQDMLNESERS